VVHFFSILALFVVYLTWLAYTALTLHGDMMIREGDEEQFFN